MVNLRFCLGSAALLLAPTHAASLVRRDCAFSMPAQQGDTCQRFASAWGISVAQFTLWNAGTDCSARLVVGKEYCILWDGPDPGTPASSTSRGPSTTLATSTRPPVASSTQPGGPSPTQSGIAENCEKWYRAVAGDFCQAIVDKHGRAFTLQDFYKWNPAVGNKCGSLWPDYYYCVRVPGSSNPPDSGAPGPVQEGIAKDCEEYYKVQSGDLCYKIVDKHPGLRIEDFYKWNPAVGSNCNSLWPEYYVCVKAPDASTSPSPTQPGINPNCKSYYKVASGDICINIVERYGISLNNLEVLASFAAVKSRCLNLIL